MYTIDPATGAPSEVQGSPFPVGQVPYVHFVDASNRFLYMHNQGSSSVRAFAIGDEGTLTEVQGSPFAAGKTSVAIVATP